MPDWRKLTSFEGTEIVFWKWSKVAWMNKNILPKTLKIIQRTISVIRSNPLWYMFVEFMNIGGTGSERWSHSWSWLIFVCDKAAERAFRPLDLIRPINFFLKGIERKEMQFSSMDRLLNFWVKFERNWFCNPNSSGRFLGGQPLNYHTMQHYVEANVTS